MKLWQWLGSLTYDTKIDKDGFNKGIKNMEGSVKSGGSKIKNIVSSLGIDKLFSSAVGIINNNIDGAISRIDTLNNFPRVMSNLGIASEDSEKAVKKLSDGLQGIPTSLDDASVSVQRFTSVNGDVNKSTEYFLALNNALLAGGASTEIQASAMEQLSQAYSKGKPDMEEWRSLQTAMPAQLKQVAQAFNMTTDELGESLRSGKVSMNDFMDKIVELNENGTGEFQSFAEQAKNSTGGIQTSISNAKTAIIRGVANIITAFDEALKSNGLGGISEVINNIGKIAEYVLKKVASLIPKVISKIKDICNWAMQNQQVVKNLIKVIISVVAAYKALKTILTLVNAIKTAKNILSQVSAFMKLTPIINTAKKAMLLFNTACSANPIGLVIVAVVALTSALALFALKNDSIKKSVENVAAGFSSFYEGIKIAEGYLESFNSELFVSSEEQQQLKTQMDEVQKGITQICKTASDERRGYTQDEIKQLDEYFTKLRELKNREIEMQQSIAGAITQQAKTNAEKFNGSFAEYKEQSKKWIKTAQDQRDETIKLIQRGTIEETTLLNQRYKTEEERQSEAYQNEYNAIMERQQNRIDAANQEVAQVSKIYSDGYLERSKHQNGFYDVILSNNSKIEEENNRHANKMDEIMKNSNLNIGQKIAFRQMEEEKHSENMNKIWNKIYKNMSDEQVKELGEWMARLSHTEMYGGEISETNKEMVDNIISSYDNMPSGAKKKMQETMEGMLKGMQDEEPTLYAKASGIADGVLGRLKKAFNINSPSKETRKIFKYVMEGAELGLEDEENNLMKQIDDISESVIAKMNKAVSLETGSINAKAILQSNKEQPIVIARDTQNTINNTQNFYNKETTPYEQQREAKQQLRRLAYGL